MQNNAQSNAKKFLKEYNLQEVSLVSLRDVLKKQGYTIVEFNSVVNDTEITTLIETLHLEKHIEHSRGFTYVDRYKRLVFVNEDLSDDEKLVVLSHEEGHIYCNHFSVTPIIGKDVAEEHEANEFSHYILNLSATQRCKGLLRKNKKVVGISLILCVVIFIGVLVFSITRQEKSYYGEYYITSTGNKYHEKDCIFVKDKNNIQRLTKEQYESEEYEPCAMCLPE